MSNEEWIKTGIGLLQAVLSGVFVGLIIYWLDERRAKRDRRLSDFRIASNWFTTEPKVSLRNFDLAKMNLAGQKFMKAKLEDTIFYETALWATNLSDANLRKADFRKARLVGAKLIRAIARKADFSRAVIRNGSDRDYGDTADFSNADLQGCKFVGARLDGVTIIKANLQRADFSKALVLNCNFTGSDLTGSNWKKVKQVQNCIWRDVRIDNQENLPQSLLDEILRQNAKPNKKRKTEK